MESAATRRCDESASARCGKAEPLCNSPNAGFTLARNADRAAERDSSSPA